MVERLKQVNDEKPVIYITANKKNYDPVLKIIDTCDTEQLINTESELKSMINNLELLNPQIKLKKLDQLISHH